MRPIARVSGCASTNDDEICAKIPTHFRRQVKPHFASPAFTKAEQERLSKSPPDPALESEVVTDRFGRIPLYGQRFRPVPIFVPTTIYQQLLWNVMHRVQVTMEWLLIALGRNWRYPL